MGDYAWYCPERRSGHAVCSTCISYTLLPHLSLPLHTPEVAPHGSLIFHFKLTRYFDNIVPCGIEDEALSVGALSDWCPDATVPHVADTFLQSFLRNYDLDADYLCGDEAIEEMYDVFGGQGQGMKKKG